MNNQSKNLVGTLYLSRHGETEANSAKIVQGTSDTPLTELGRRQAEALGKRLQGSGVAAIASSDLPRAVATAEIVQQFVKAETVVQWPEVRERSWGIYDLKPVELYWKARRDFEEQNPGKEFLPPGGEPLHSVASRVTVVLEKLEKLLPTTSVLVVGHAAFNREFLRHLLHPGQKNAPRYEQDSACLNVISFGSGDFRIQVQRLNCTAHWSGLNLDH
jgi:broad specificity phosphatase PhoE